MSRLWSTSKIALCEWSRFATFNPRELDADISPIASVYHSRNMKKILETLKLKWTEYLLEIFVITFGILGAFGLNNWNEVRKEAAKEQQILGQLIEEYHLNLLQLDQKIRHRKKIIKAANTLLEYVDKPTGIVQDSINAQLSILIGNPTYKPILNNLINSGDIRLIKNEDLKQLLISWPSNILSVNEPEQMWADVMEQSLIPFLIDVGILRESLFKWWNDEQNTEWILEGDGTNPFAKTANRKMNSDEMLRNKEVEGISSWAVSLNHSGNIQSQILRKRILKIIALLEQSIDKE